MTVTHDLDKLYAPASEAFAYARNYRGTFGFMVSMRERIEADKSMSAGQIAAILRCKASDELRGQRRATPAHPAERGTDLDLSSLPDGTSHAAVPDASGVLQFFKIDHVTKGKWSGWIFVRRQAGDNFDRIGSQKPDGRYVGGFADLLRTVAADPTAALQRYGVELGRCALCNRSLTDETSRKRGIGPECWDRKVAH